MFGPSQWWPLSCHKSAATQRLGSFLEDKLNWRSQRAFMILVNVKHLEFLVRRSFISQNRIQTKCCKALCKVWRCWSALYSCSQCSDFHLFWCHCCTQVNTAGCRLTRTVLTQMQRGGDEKWNKEWKNKGCRSKMNSNTVEGQCLSFLNLPRHSTYLQSINIQYNSSHLNQESKSIYQIKTAFSRSYINCIRYNKVLKQSSQSCLCCITEETKTCGQNVSLTFTSDKNYCEFVEGESITVGPQQFILSLCKLCSFDTF